MTDRLETRADFERFQQAARQRWDALWQGDQLIVSVAVDSSSEPKGALRVLAACREAMVKAIRDAGQPVAGEDRKPIVDLVSQLAGQIGPPIRGCIVHHPHLILEGGFPTVGQIYIRPEGVSGMQIHRVAPTGLTLRSGDKRDQAAKGDWERSEQRHERL